MTSPAAIALGALVDALCDYVDRHSLEHEDDECPEDDTCDCQVYGATSRALDAGLALLRSRHPDVLEKLHNDGAKRFGGTEGLTPELRQALAAERRRQGVDWSSVNGKQVLDLLESAPQVAGKWDDIWTTADGTKRATRYSCGYRGDWREAARIQSQGNRWEAFTDRRVHAIGDFGGAEEAMAACDAELRRLGWKLVGDPTPENTGCVQPYAHAKSVDAVQAGPALGISAGAAPGIIASVRTLVAAANLLRLAWSTDGLDGRGNVKAHPVEERALVRALNALPASLHVAGRESVPGLDLRQRRALLTLLIHIGSWTSARWDQHLRNDVGDTDADAVIRWVREWVGDERVIGEEKAK